MESPAWAYISKFLDVHTRKGETLIQEIYRTKALLAVHLPRTLYLEAIVGGTCTSTTPR